MTLSSLQEALLFDPSQAKTRLTQVLAGCIHPSCTDCTLGMITTASELLLTADTPPKAVAVSKSLQENYGTLKAKLHQAWEMENRLRSGQVSPKECIEATLAQLANLLRRTSSEVSAS